MTCSPPGWVASGLAVWRCRHCRALRPTPAELRRRAIYNNYRALVDMTDAGGYRTLYGPNVTADGSVGSVEGRIAGTEFLAFSRGADADPRPKRGAAGAGAGEFRPGARPCIVTATSFGLARRVRGHQHRGEWGLKRGCAVAYTDKGTGSAPHDLTNDSVQP